MNYIYAFANDGKKINVQNDIVSIHTGWGNFTLLTLSLVLNFDLILEFCIGLLDCFRFEIFWLSVCCSVDRSS